MGPLLDLLNILLLQPKVLNIYIVLKSYEGKDCKLIRLTIGTKGQWQLVLESEWSPDLDTRNTVRYYGKKQVWHQTTISTLASIMQCHTTL